jgi:hypothetical protein
MKYLLYCTLLLWISSIAAQNYSNSFTKKWEDLPWGDGGLTPTGVIWSLDGIYDFDSDNLGEFLFSSSWSGSFGNDAILYESTGNDSFQIVWYYWFNNLDLSDFNHSSITTGDLDLDNIPEIIILIDCLAGQDGLYIFEFDTILAQFPTQPTTTWNINQSNGIDEACAITIANLDSDPRPELIMSFYSRDPAASHLMIVELMNGTDLSNPSWHMEMDDNTTFAYYSYSALAADLDQDGFKEIIVIEWNYNRLVIFENTGENNYQKVNDLFLTFEPLAFSNEGAAETDLDNDGLNELFLTSSAGYFWVVTNPGDVSQITFEDNFHLLYDYKSNGGYSLTQCNIGNADSPLGQVPDGPDIYFAATDTSATQSHLFDWEYLGGDVTNPNNYNVYKIFSDSTQSGELFKISKFGIGDSDNNGTTELVLGSFSLDLNKPHITVIESDLETALETSKNEKHVSKKFILYQNYPNPFNPQTTIEFDIFRQSEVTLTIYNAIGQVIKQLVNSILPAGTYTFQWNGTNDQNVMVPSGVYYYRLKAENFSDAKKMLFIR